MTTEQLRIKIFELDDETKSILDNFKFNLSLKGMPIKGVSFSELYDIVITHNEYWSKIDNVIFKQTKHYFKLLMDFFETNYIPNLVELIKINNQRLHSIIQSQIANLEQNNVQLFNKNDVKVSYLLDLLENKIDVDIVKHVSKIIYGEIIDPRAYTTNIQFAFYLSSNFIYGRTKLKSYPELDIDLSKDIIEQSNDYKINLQTSFEEYHSLLKLKLTEFANEFDKSKTEKENLFNEWYLRTKGEFDSFNNDAIDKNKKLITTYTEQIKLKKPAEFWETRSQELNKEGNKYLRFLIIAIVICIIPLYFLLWVTPEGMLKSFFSEDKGVALRWTIVFITFISFLVVAVRVFLKLTFSSFHLAKDAEERKHLTIVYLSMIHDSSISSDDRNLILQSLFSRADTGLLKDDSSPTMPGINNIISK
jgi:hypothetical protein